MLNFIIPIRHPTQVTNIARQKLILAQTFRSISMQSGNDWRAIVVANIGTELPFVPDNMQVLWVDIAPSKKFDKVKRLEDFYAAVCDDKGRRVFEAARIVPKDQYIMVVDDDDLIDKTLSEYTKALPGYHGWSIIKGFKWDVSTGNVFHLDNFHRVCGTSQIVRADYYLFNGERFSGASPEAISELGSHSQVFDRAIREKQPFKHIDERMAIYRVNHENASQQDLSSRGFGPRLNLLRKIKRSAESFITGNHRHNGHISEKYFRDRFLKEDISDAHLSLVEVK